MDNEQGSLLGCPTLSWFIPDSDTPSQSVLEKPVSLPWHIYGLMALMFLAAMWFLIDLESIARAILSVREGLRAL